jgi:hypothetical protein
MRVAVSAGPGTVAPALLVGWCAPEDAWPYTQGAALQGVFAVLESPLGCPDLVCDASVEMID